MRNTIATLVVTLCFICANAYADTYYVGINGSDKTGDGSVDKPWRTVNFALSESKNGDAISLNNGTYIENTVRVPEGVSLTATDREKGQVYIKPNRKMKYMIELASDLPGSNGNQTISHLNISGKNGDNLANIGILVSNRNNVTIAHNHIHDCSYGWSHGVLAMSTEIEFTSSWGLYWPKDSSRQGDEQAISELWPKNGTRNFVLENNVIVNCGYRESLNNGVIYGAVKLFNLRDSIISNNSIDSTSSRAQCISSCCAFLDNVDFINNELKMNRYNDRSSYIIELWCLRRGCEFIGNKANACFSIAVGKETIIRNNFIQLNPHYDGIRGNLGIEFTVQSYGKVNENYIEGSAWGIVAGLNRGHAGRKVSDVEIYGNIIRNVSQSGIMVKADGKENRHTTVERINVDNNTLIKNIHKGYGMIRIAQLEFGGISDVNIRNNLILNSVDCASYKSGDIENLNVERNLFWGNGINDFCNAEDKLSLAVDPKIVITEETYPQILLDSESPCIDSGVDIGKPYVGASPDIGAVEYLRNNMLRAPRNVTVVSEEN